MKNKLENILKYILYLFAFLLPLQTRLFIRSGEIVGGYSEYLTISLYGIDILLLLIILLNSFIFFQVLKEKDFIFNKLLYLLVGLDLVVFLSIFFAADIWLAIHKYVVFLLGVGLFWVLISANYNKVKLLLSLIAGLFLQACLGTWQFLMQGSFSNKWLGLASHNSGDLGVSVIEALGGDGVWERWMRAYGGFDHPNILGSAMAIGLLIILSLYLKNKQENLKIKKYLLLVSYILLFIALVFSFSRAAWLGFTVGLIILLFSLVIKKDYYKQRELLIVILISVALTALIYSQYSNLFQTRLSLDSRLENISYVERVSSMKDSKEIIKDNILFGTGIGNYVLDLEKNTSQNHPSYYFQPAHNIFLLIWSEIGIFGLLFFILLMLYLLINNYKNKKYFNIAILLSMTTMMMFDHWWWSLHFGILLFWFIIGISYSNINNK